MIINQNFTPKRQRDDRLPPGQYETRDFPVLSFGPTPDVDLAEWRLECFGLCTPLSWSFEELAALPHEDITTDIHCVTKWSKFDTKWRGVSLDVIIEKAGVDLSRATHLIAHSEDGYTTNLPIEDVTSGKAWVVDQYDGEAIEPEHGGPVRLFVPHLYFWKSAKWLTKLEFIDHDEAGFWETRGYHNYGDPWKEQRYTFD